MLRERTVFDDMYDIAFGKPLSLEQLERDKVFQANLQNTINAANKLINITSKEFFITEINRKSAIGTIVLSGKLVEGNNDTINNVFEQRVITLDRTYYLFVIIHPEEDTVSNIISIDDSKSKVQSNIDMNSIMIDGLSRSIDYLLDCIHHDSYVMSELNHRDGLMSNDPVIIIAKAVLLYNSRYGRAIFDSIQGENAEDELRDVCDKLITRNLRVDWLSNGSFKSTDKANVFSAQLLLKEEIYTLCRNMGTNDNDDTFYINYQSLFIDGDIYKLGVYDYIPSFIAVGSNAFSTEALETIWAKYK